MAFVLFNLAAVAALIGIDQLLNLEWKILMPVCLLNLILMSVVVIL